MTLDDLLEKNRALRNAHIGKRCFIVGNGPSIKAQNLSCLHDEVTIAVSSFFRHPDAKAIHPNYWVLADPLFWKRPDEFLLPTLNMAIEKAVDVKLFVPTGGVDAFLKINAGPLIDLHFFHYDPAKNIQSRIDFTTGVPQYGQNVIVVCLMLAFYLGCNPIYFIGCDHDFMNVTQEEYDTMKVEHFYANPSQHKASEHLTWNQWQAAMERMNYEYDQLKQYAGIHGFDVYNATHGGYFDNFSRIDFDSLFAPSLNLLSIGAMPAEQNRRDAHHIGTAAVRLMNAGDHESAHVLLNEATKCNINTPRRVEGLHYLKALCLAKFREYEAALIEARCDQANNPSNRDKSALLIRQLESVCGIQAGGILRA